eukprot:6174890-Pleurochrysis_carterae.AAC.4
MVKKRTSKKILQTASAWGSASCCLFMHLRVPLGGDDEDGVGVAAQQVAPGERAEGASRVRDAKHDGICQIERRLVHLEPNLRDGHHLPELAEQLVGREREDLQLGKDQTHVSGELLSHPEAHLRKWQRGQKFAVEIECRSGVTHSCVQLCKSSAALPKPAASVSPIRAPRTQ